MFTGLVEAIGVVRLMRRFGASARCEVACPALADGLAVGDSIAVNGCCLTVVELKGDTLIFDCLAETLNKTNLAALSPGDSVNLERALRADARLGGHFMQGHVDCTAEVWEISEEGLDLNLRIELPLRFAPYLAGKGSIAVNGVSLTAGSEPRDGFEVWIIPHTRSATNLGSLRAGQKVNLEFDLLAKYVERLLEFKQGNKW